MHDSRNLYDIIVVGGGPAGLSAAIYAARAKERVLVIEKNAFGGQIALTAKVLNYPGLAPCSGKDLTAQMKKQAEDFGAECIVASIHSMDLEAPIKTIHTNQGDFQAFGVILAPGAVPRDAGFEGENQFKGHGVAYCATCDGPLFDGCDIYVVGGGLAAVEEAIFLNQFAKKLTLVVREKDFTCEKTVSDQLKLHPDIRILFHTEILKVDGNQQIDTIILKDNVSQKIWTEESQEGPMGVFVFVGYEPNTSWLPASIEKDSQGYLLTNRENCTNLQGVCAAGDVRQKSLRQVVTATADGAIAAVSLEGLVKKMHQKYQVPSLVKEEDQLTGLSQTSGKAIVKLWLDESNLAEEMLSFFEEKKGLQSKIQLEIHKEGREDVVLPSIEICNQAGVSSGIHFHAVPNGLEWNSFQMALFNVMGPGQKMEDGVLERIRKISLKVNLKIFATLTCSNCPASVMSACQIAAFNENVKAEMFDLVHFRKLRFKYNISSVPLLMINDEFTIVGIMEVSEMLDHIEHYLKSKGI